MNSENKETRSENLFIKLTPTEKIVLTTSANKVGLNLSDFVRLLIRQWADGIKFERKEE